MSKSERLQVLIEPSQSARLHQVAQRRGVPVAVVVRDAIDAEIGRVSQARQAAAKRILAFEPIDVPLDPNDLEDEIARQYDDPDE